MPNWNNNSVTIDGPKDKIEALWARATAGEEAGLLNAMVPMPVALRDTFKGTGDEAQTELHDGFTNWYDWSVSRWGVKWDVSSEGLQFIDNGNGTASIVGYADSAWSPPIEAFRTYANANEDVYLEIKYFEPGMSFIGVWDSEGGDAYWEDVGRLVQESAENDDEVLAELFEEFNVWDWYDFEDENLEIDLDGSVSATNE